MPTPIEILLDPISLTILALYAGLAAWEALAPGRPLPAVRGHVTRGMLSFVCYFYLSSYLPLLWDGYLAPYQLLDLTGLGVAGGAGVGLLAYECGAWAWHRAMHAFGPLWRMHQLHHSPSRLDAYSAFTFHPLDMVGWTALASLVLVLGIGVVPGAATLILVVTSLLGIFQHTNVRTPRWLGYLVQRPESHTVHHARGIHGHNYADLPIIDLLMGTFDNPAGYGPEVGFGGDTEQQVADMLLLRDVSTGDDSTADADADRPEVRAMRSAA